MNSDLIYGNKLNFISFSELEVYKTNYSIKSTNAVGYVDISLKFVKLMIPFILPTLTRIYNHKITTNICLEKCTDLSCH